MKHSYRWLLLALALALPGCVARPRTNPVEPVQPPVVVDPAPVDPAPVQPTPKPSTSKFSQIQKGWTVAQVEALVGRGTDVAERTSEVNTLISRVLYFWNENGVNFLAEVKYQNGLVTNVLPSW